ncbi:orotate phosphoribosyltransferase [Scytonema sp. NUACC26]|uniref:orotate phosphoribosyltransferase n=1 Tax=Scytonema sp. NUACC26 TaxID=3140176 RepID=UPI0034DBCA63
MDKNELVREIALASHLKGRFRLRSGEMSSHYFDKYQFESNPILLKHLAIGMAKMIPQDTEVLAGLELGGIPLAVAISLEIQLPVVFVRKERKTYGTEKIVEGIDISGKRLCMIEDVITTGGQVVKSVEVLRAMGAHINCVLCAIWRSAQQAEILEKAGIREIHYFSMQEILMNLERL